MTPAPWLLALLATTALALLFALGTVILRKGRTEDEARAYLAGVTYVLLDDPDGAIAELSKAARLNTQTYGTYFALAELFRRKGDFARAIRLNQNILLRPGVCEEVRHRAQLELAWDYRRSGLKEQAVETFEKLLSEKPSAPEVLVKYRQLLEETDNLPRAVEIQGQLVQPDGGGKNILANLLAELSRGLLEKQPEEALTLARRAAHEDETSANANLALGEALFRAGETSGAAGPLKLALTLEPERIPRSLPLLVRVVGNAAEVRRWLEEGRDAHPASTAPYELALALWHKQQGNHEDALAQLKSLLERHPSDWDARRELGALLLVQNRAEELRAAYEEILGTMGQPALGFACRGCGEKLAEHSFRCPLCGAWDQVYRDGPQAGGVAKLTP